MKKQFYTADELHKEFMRDPKYRRAYNALEPEFQIAKQIIDARLKRNLTQKELARKVKTGQAVISRLEGMEAKPTISLLARVAQALNTKIHITIQ